MNVSGCTALVTGASSGIGRATCLALARAGAQLMLSGRDPVRLAQLAQRTGGAALAGDLTEPEGFDQISGVVTEVDLLVHCAGQGWAGELATMTAHDIHAVTELNLVVPMRLTRAALPGMLARGRGHVVLMSSVATVGVRDEAVYSATKAGLRAFAASLRHEVGDVGIGVTTVLPGAVDTPFFRHRGRSYDRKYPRMIGPGEVAREILRAVHHERSEIFVPQWLGIAARLNGAMPTQFERLAHRFG